MPLCAPLNFLLDTGLGMHHYNLFKIYKAKMRTMKTYTAKPKENPSKWYLVDADGCVLGRLASFVAARLRGKHKPIFTPHVDTGDHIVVINADKVTLTGDKWNAKVYYRHSGYMGGLKSRTAREVLEKRPQDLLKHAVKGMLPKNRLGRRIFRKLKVYAGPEHPHEAQSPETIQL